MTVNAEILLSLIMCSALVRGFGHQTTEPSLSAAVVTRGVCGGVWGVSSLSASGATIPGSTWFEGKGEAREVQRVDICLLPARYLHLYTLDLKVQNIAVHNH